MKVHVLLKKAELDEALLDASKTVVVFDILLATSTISACLSFGARAVVPAETAEEAQLIAQKRQDEAVCLAGESNGLPITGFVYPLPLALQHEVKGKTLILVTTNGTVAIRKAAKAGKVWIASLLNSETVARKVSEEYKDETILLVCAGSNNKFCLEDFYGAGYFLSQLVVKTGGAALELTDSARAANLFYESQSSNSLSILKNTRVGESLMNMEFERELHFVSQKSLIETAPYLFENEIVCDSFVSVYRS